MNQIPDQVLYRSFSREQWKQCGHQLPFIDMLDQQIPRLAALNEPLTPEEIRDIYLPLACWLHDHILSYQQLRQKLNEHLPGCCPPAPYIIGLAGSVAAGKSTASRTLQFLLKQWPQHARVENVSTDGFLYPNRVLEEKGILNKKGFPESYDVKKLIEFLKSLKAGQDGVRAPVYSHLHYDVLPDQYIELHQPDVLILEGINVLQVGMPGERRSSRNRVQSAPLFVSDFFDISLYVHAEEPLLRKWYIDRFLLLRETAFKRPESYFHQYASLSDAEAIRLANEIWETINLPNLMQNILPTRRRATLILDKGENHAVQQVHVRLI
ncbi:MAG: type I pantothenate kinase [Thermoflavifilum sp.]|jgi:type I pantothenate kinase|uniref:type I pantothenate kinase n=1 Tax=Thermoflavifilum sp. TaxID=1968839 RepID=UPI0018A34AB9|nr:type I pantothenate kinase [Thermoflavifilum sp.]QOR76022.1 MAG: type I pantothenate kinase [Thermoflavifilum sp.]